MFGFALHWADIHLCIDLGKASLFRRVRIIVAFCGPRIHGTIVITVLVSDVVCGAAQSANGWANCGSWYGIVYEPYIYVVVQLGYLYQIEVAVEVVGVRLEQVAWQH